MFNGTRYEVTAKKMVQELPELLKMIEDNYGKIPTKALGTRYGMDGSAARGILIGIIAVKNNDNKKD